MKRQFLLAGAAVFILSVSAGAYLAFSGSNPEPGKETPAYLNVTASDEQDVVTANFYNSSLNLMHESGKEAVFYIDTNRDGSFDIRLDGLKRDGKVHNTTEIVTKGDSDYRLYFRYRDSPEVEGDAWLRLFLVEKLG